MAVGMKATQTAFLSNIARQLWRKWLQEQVVRAPIVHHKKAGTTLGHANWMVDGSYGSYLTVSVGVCSARKSKNKMTATLILTVTSLQRFVPR